MNRLAGPRNPTRPASPIASDAMPPVALRRTPSTFLTLALLVATVFATRPSVAQEGGAAPHMVIVGVDGLSPDGVQKARTPNLDGLMQRGAHTFHARAVMPSSSSPNWASMIMGAGPEQHGVLSNDWEPDSIELEPACKGPGGRYPTIFSALREQRPGAVTAVFHDWDGFGRLVEPDAPNVIKDGDGPDATVAEAVAYVKENRPLFTFIHLDHVDHAGHEYGHGTPQYYAAVEEADRLIGEVLDGLKAAGILDQTVILVTADHGGVGKGHGGSSLAEMEIPWIIAGPGVRAGETITFPVNTFDTAATAAYVLGVTQPACWIARPVMAAFTEHGTH